MKKAILIFCCVLLSSLSWAQDSHLADAARAKAQQSPANEAKRMVVYPNPSKGIVHLTLAGFKGEKTELRIMNVIGNVVYRETLTEPEDRFTKTIDLTKSANGLYYVKLESEDFSQIRKIILE
jgi:hypothetical protein